MIHVNTYDVLGRIEQGSIGSSGNTSSSTRVRSANYISAFVRPQKITINVTGNKPVQVDLLGYNSNSTNTPLFDLYWFENGHEFDVSKYTNLKYIRIVLQFEDKTKITPADITSCEITVEWEVSWYMQDEGIYNEFFSELPEAMKVPYPKALWRIRPNTNGGLPYNELLPDIESIHITPVKQPPYIIIYDMQTEQTEFKNHGLCILHPSECTETETMNGAWEVSLTHPIDSSGIWQYIVESNILKIDEQLFIIRKTEHSFSGGTGTVKAWAEHIFYVMNEAWISPFDEWGGSVQSVINQMIDFNDSRYAEQDVKYFFDGKSDIDKIIPKQVEGAGETPVQAMIGEAGLISQVGGFLYRDNFYFSINKEMENSQKDAFDIRVGKDLTGIRRIVDLSNFVTFFLGYLYDSTYFFGKYWIWNKGNEQFYRTVKQSKTFNYSSLGLTFADEAQRLEQDVTAYFDAYCKPLLSYEFDIQDLSQNPEYSEFTNMPRYKVGDVGKVYDERLGVTLNLPITKTRKNHVTHRVEKVWIGNAQRTFTRPAAYNVDISALGRAEETEIVGQLKDYEYNDIYDAAGNEILIKIERGDE